MGGGDGGYEGEDEGDGGPGVREDQGGDEEVVGYWWWRNGGVWEFGEVMGSPV